MHPKDLLKQLDSPKIVAAIAEAECKTSGEIRIYISHKTRTNALIAAQNRFEKLGLFKTRHRNAVLLYLVPRTRSFAIIGDTGVHEKCGDDFWTQASAELSADLRSMPITEALIRTVQKVGELLASHFPSEPGAVDEYPKEILHD